MHKFILPLTLKEHPCLGLHDTVIESGLILIDGAVAHLLKAAYICPPVQYTRTNSDCFLPLVLGWMPGTEREGEAVSS